MKYIANENSIGYYNKCKKELLRFLYTAPFFIGLISLLFIVGAKNKLHLIFSIFLLIGLTSFIIISIITLFKKVNNTIAEISVVEKNIEFKTFRILFLSSKTFVIEKEMLKLRKHKFNIYKKLEDGWKIDVKKTNIILFESFFDKEILNYLI